MIDHIGWWALLLIVQNASFTLVSRARNSGSYWYHAVAAVGSNGIWFASQFLLIGMVVKPGLSAGMIATLAGVYVASTVFGSVLMHWISVRFIEKGKRKVGG